MELIRNARFPSRYQDLVQNHWHFPHLTAQSFRRFRWWLRQGPNPEETAPSLIYWSPTMRCSHGCEMCDFRRNGALHSWPEQTGELTSGQLMTVARRLQATGSPIYFGGGEPLQFKHFALSLVTLSQGRPRFVGLTTNGMFLATHAELIVKARLGVLHLSLHGSQPIHDAVTQVNDAFVRATEGLALLKEERRRQRSPFPRIIINFSISESNCRNIGESIRDLLELGPDSMVLQHPFILRPEDMARHVEQHADLGIRPGWLAGGSVRPSIGTEQWDVEVLREGYQAARSLAARRGVRMDIIPPLEAGEVGDYYATRKDLYPGKSCRALTRVAQVMPNGDVVPSGVCFHRACGNLLEEDFAPIWNSPPYREARRRSREDGPFPLCFRCVGHTDRREHVTPGQA